MESQMNKISMDALNSGWNLGFGTRLQAVDADFAQAKTRSDATAPAATPQVARIADRLAGYTATAQAFLFSIFARPAH
jgi:hypothetical protein